MEKLSSEELDRWLTWAGSKLLSLPGGRAGPSGYKTANLDYVEDRQAYGYTLETLRAPAVRPEEIAIMELILTFPALASDIRVRRIIHMRAQVTPVSNKHVHSYKAIAIVLHLDARLAARLYAKGLAQLAKRIPPAQIRMIRGFFTANETFS